MPDGFGCFAGEADDVVEDGGAQGVAEPLAAVLLPCELGDGGQGGHGRAVAAADLQGGVEGVAGDVQRQDEAGAVLGVFSFGGFGVGEQFAFVVAFGFDAEAQVAGVAAPEDDDAQLKVCAAFEVQGADGGAAAFRLYGRRCFFGVDVEVHDTWGRLSKCRRFSARERCGCPERGCPVGGSPAGAKRACPGLCGLFADDGFDVAGDFDFRLFPDGVADFPQQGGVFLAFCQHRPASDEVGFAAPAYAAQ